MKDLYTDVRFTRKLRDHAILDEAGQHLSHHGTVDAALERLHADGETEIRLIGEGSSWIITFRPCPDPTEDPQEPENGKTNRPAAVP